MKVILSLFLPLIGLSLTNVLTAQQLPVQQPLTYASKEIWFDKIVSRENTSLINGPEYFMPFKGASTNPFFKSMDLTNEKVVYEHQVYENVPLFYDLYSDVLVLRIRDKNGLFAMVSLDKNKVEGFTLYGHLFKKMMDPKSAQGSPSYHYYDVLFEGKNLMLVARRMKSGHVTGFVTDYELEENYYLIRDGNWSQLSGTRSFYSLMPGKKDQILGFIDAKNIKVRKKSENDFIDIATYCDSLEGH